MDKRVVKTRHLIYQAFATVLKEKGYSKMTVEDILQASGVSRSTFYTHFRTKEDVLSSISEGMHFAFLTIFTGNYSISVL